MATKIYTVALLLIIAVATIFSTCKKGGPGCANNNYSFQTGINLSPDKDSIRIGDTLWINLNTSSRFTDIPTGNLVDYSGATNFGNVIYFIKFLNGKQSVGAIDHFDFLLLKGNYTSIVDPLQEKDFLFTEENGTYVFKLAIIPKDTGRYVINISSSAGVIRRNDKCTQASIGINIVGTNQHFYFVQQWDPSAILDDFGKKHVYYFKVY